MMSVHTDSRRAEFADITYSYNGGKSDYHAFQGKLQWRVGAGFNVLSSLTLSRARDNGAGSLENPNGDSPAPQDFYNIDAEWGLSAYHQPYNSTTSLVADLPFGRGRKWGSSMPAVLDAILGGWQVAGINTVTAGERVTLRYTPTAAQQVSGIQQDFRGANGYRPNVQGTVVVSNWTVQNYLNRDAVIIPTDPSQPFGNATRNSVAAPMFWGVDFQASKRFALWASSQLELRVEAFNLLNRSNFRAPNGNRSSVAFGTITATYDPRIVQVAAKISF